MDYCLSAVNVIDAVVKTVVVPISLISTVIIASKGDPTVVVAALVHVGLAAQLINDPVVPVVKVPDVTVAIASYFEAEVVGTTQLPKEVVPSGDLTESIEPVLEIRYAAEAFVGEVLEEEIAALEIFTKSPPLPSIIIPTPLIRKPQRR